MQLGIRWRAGDPPHRSVPPELHDSITQQEARHPGASSWVLTWLEGRPRCALEDLVVVTLDASGNPVATQPNLITPEPIEATDDDWLK